MGLSLKILTGLIGILLAMVWIQGTINPQAIASNFSIHFETLKGLNTFRADMLGFFLTSASFCFLYLKTSNKQWLLAAIIAMGSAALGRASGLLLDGYAQESLGGMILELVFISIFALTYQKS